MPCTLCQTRPARRHCPALTTDICARCCGEQREQTIDCPFTCEHLLAAREREPLSDMPDTLPNADITTEEGVIRHIEPLVMLVMGALFVAAGQCQATDLDLRAAVAAMIQERRGEEMEALSDVAKSLKDEFDLHFEKFQREITATGAQPSERIDVVALVFIQREEFMYNNGRARSRAYIDRLRLWVSEMANRAETGATEAES